MNFSRLGVCILGVCLLVGTSFGATGIQGDTVTVDTDSVGSSLIAGSIVSLVTDQIGDVFVAGQTVSLDSVIDGDVWAIGETLSINNTVNDDVRVAGRSITIDAPIAGELRAASESLTINASPALPSHLYGESIIINSPIASGSTIQGTSLLINTSLVGPLTIDTESLVISEGTTLQGEITTHSESLQDIIASAGGEVQYIASTKPTASKNNQTGGFNFPWFGLLSIVIFSLIVLSVFPNYIHRASKILKKYTRESLGLGAGVLIGVPIVSLFLLISVVGAPVAGILLMIWISILIFLKVIIVVVSSDLLWREYTYFQKTYRHKLLVVLIISIIISVLPGLLIFIIGCFVVGACVQQDWKILKEIA